MFNFKLYNMALEDATLTDKEFRMLCLFLNKSSMDKSNTIEMFNGFLMDKLGLCERHVRRLTNSLENKGYFTKTITGTVKNRNANTYTLKNVEDTDKNVPPCNIEEDKNVDKKCDKNVPPCNIEEDKNVDKKCDKNVPLNKGHLNNNKNITTGILDISPEDIDEIKEKINKKEMDKVNEVSDNGVNVKNGEMKCNEMELDDSSTVVTGANGESSNMKIINETKCDTPTGAMDNTDPTQRENNKPQNDGIYIFPPSPQEQIERKRAAILANVESAKKFMYETTKSKNVNEWKAQMDYITIQFKNLQKITSDEAYKGIRADFKRWWDATKPYFPKGYDEALKPPTPQDRKKLQTELNETDANILNNWIEKKDIRIIGQLLDKWMGKYDQDTLERLFEDAMTKINAPCATVTDKVDNHTTQPIATQPDARERPKIKYIELEEERGEDNVCDSAQIISLNKKYHYERNVL